MDGWDSNSGSQVFTTATLLTVLLQLYSMIKMIKWILFFNQLFLHRNRSKFCIETVFLKMQTTQCKLKLVWTPFMLAAAIIRKSNYPLVSV